MVWIVERQCEVDVLDGAVEGAQVEWAGGTVSNGQGKGV